MTGRRSLESGQKSTSTRRLMAARHQAFVQCPFHPVHVSSLKRSEAHIGDTVLRDPSRPYVALKCITLIHISMLTFSSQHFHCKCIRRTIKHHSRPRSRREQLCDYLSMSLMWHKPPTTSAAGRRRVSWLRQEEHPVKHIDVSSTNMEEMAKTPAMH